MVILTLGATSENIILTLDEKKTLADPAYTFQATHVTTKEVISFTLGADLSTHKARYNEFTVNASTAFLNATAGQYSYIVIEQVSNIQVENGKLLLNKSANFNYIGYEPATTYKGYEG